MTCTFFGNRDIIGSNVETRLWELLVDFVKHKNVNNFYVGNQGRFDSLVLEQLKNLKKIYPHINYGIALAYVPTDKENCRVANNDKAFVPDGVENGPMRFAIDRRNRWLIKNSDYVITCVRGSMGGAAKYKEIAERKGKIVINIKG